MEMRFHVTAERARAYMRARDWKALEAWQGGKAPTVTQIVAVLSKFVFDASGYVSPETAETQLDDLTLPQLEQAFQAFAANMTGAMVNPTNGDK